MLPAGADQRADALLARTVQNAADTVGEIVQLEVAGSTASALFLASRADQRSGGVILLHDLHSNADAPGVIRQLRIGLADAGWDTLSPMLPTGFDNDTVAAWVSRHTSLSPTVEAAMSWLGARDIDDIALIGVAGGGNVMLRTLAARNPPETAGIAFISCAFDAAEQQIVIDLGLPTLDIFAEFDYVDVRQAVAERREALADAPGYVQREMAGASAGFSGVEDGLVATVRAWLNGVVKTGRP